MIVFCHFQKLDLSHELQVLPKHTSPSSCHLESLAPSRTVRFRQMCERALGRHSRSQHFRMIQRMASRVQCNRSEEVTWLRPRWIFSRKTCEGIPFGVKLYQTSRSCASICDNLARVLPGEYFAIDQRIYQIVASLVQFASDTITSRVQ